MRRAASFFLPLLAGTCLFGPGCDTATEAGRARSEPPGPCGTESLDARVCGPEEACIGGSCEPWREETIAEEVGLLAALGADEVFFTSGDSLWAVPKQGGAARLLDAVPAGNLGTSLSVDGSRVLLFHNEWRDRLGWLWAYPLAGGEPERLLPTAGEEFGPSVYQAISLGDRMYAVLDEYPMPLVELTPGAREDLRTLLTVPGQLDLERAGGELFVFEGCRTGENGPHCPPALYRLTPEGTRGPALATATGRGSIRTNTRGELLFLDDTCTEDGGTLQVRVLASGAAELGAPVDLGCRAANLLEIDERYAYLRPPLTDPDRRYERRPLDGGPTTRIEGSDALWTAFGVDDDWLYGTRDGTIVRIPKK